MVKHLTIHNPKYERHLYNRRVLIVAIIVLLLTACLVVRLIYLQYIKHQTYTTLAKENQITVLPVEPTRGLIYDRNGQLLAENIPVFSLEIIPDKVKNLEKTLTDLAGIVPITDVQRQQFYKSLKQRRRFESVPLILRLSEVDMAKFAVNQYLFPGVQIKARLIRHYPNAEAFSHIIGYVGRINPQELARIDKANYSASNFIGKLGIEKYYEDSLHGRVGYQEVETNAAGRIVRVLQQTLPVPGANIHLTIDSRLQSAATAALNELAGAIVVLDPNNGEVLAMVSYPSYDPNLFVQGISDKEYKALTSDADQPLYNRIIRGQYPPGSTIKPFLALEGLRSGIVNVNYEIYDPGYFQLKNKKQRYRCWKRSGHGWVNMEEAIQQSCDTYFYDLSLKLGIKRIDDILFAFGFGHKTGIDISDELPGILPSPDWKRAHKGEAWYVGDTVITSIGQGFMLATPMQLAKATAIMALRGKMVTPTLLQKQPATIVLDDFGQQKITDKLQETTSEQDWYAVIEAMRAVTSSRRGTAYAVFSVKPPTYTVAGKTGTAQVFSSRNYAHLDGAKVVPEHLRDHALFIAFAPVEKPQVAIAVITEHAPGMAKEVARKVLDFYFAQQEQIQQVSE
jgi:penicillin-binding protein 2